MFTGIFSAICKALLSLLITLGAITGPAIDAPIVLKDSENIKMAAVVFSDTHITNAAFRGYNLECGLEDVKNSAQKFDAFIISGDITDLSDNASYEITRDIIRNADIFDNVIFAAGNHDIRFAYKDRIEYIMGIQSEFLNKEITTPYYSHDINGYTVIVMNSDEQQLERAVISDEQLAFLDSELSRATAEGKPAFVVAHQPLADTHGLPGVWATGGDLGKQSYQVREILTRYNNVFYLSGHLHTGIYEKSLEVLDEEKGVYSLNLPSFGKKNSRGEHKQSGLGVYFEVYDGEVIFTARDFRAGKALEGYSRTFTLK